MAGDDLTNDIVEYMRRQHNIRVSERMAERIKINVGSALSILEDAPEDFEVCGPNQMTALPMKVPVSYQEIAHCLDKSISKIEAAVLSALEQTPPEIVCRYRKKRHLSGRWRRFAAWYRQTFARQDGDRISRGRRSFACSSKRYGDLR